MARTGSVVDLCASTSFENDWSETLRSPFVSQSEFPQVQSAVSESSPHFSFSRAWRGTGVAGGDRAPSMPPPGYPLNDGRDNDDGEEVCPRSGSCSRHVSFSSSLSCTASCLTPLMWRLPQCCEDPSLLSSHLRTAAGNDGDAGVRGALLHLYKRGAEGLQRLDERQRSRMRVEKSDLGIR